MKTSSSCFLSFKYILDCSPVTMLFAYLRNQNDDDDDVLYIQEFADFRHTDPTGSVANISRIFSITSN